MPGGLGRSIGAGAAARAAKRTLGIDLQVGESGATAEVVKPLSILALSDGAACTFYGSALAELLRVLTGFEGAMVHERCRARAMLPAAGGPLLSEIRLMLLSGVDLNRVRGTLSDQGLDGWLLFDFRGINPILSRVLGDIGFSSRRLFVLLPREGDPVALVHKIELGPFAPANFPGQVMSYARWEELHAALRLLVEGKRVAMEISPDDAVPYLDKVPFGVVELVRRLGGTVSGSAMLTTRFAAAWSQSELGRASGRGGGAGHRCQ